MSPYTALLIGGLILLTGFVCFLLGGYVQRKKDVDEHLSRIRKVKEAENKARAALLTELERIEERRKGLKTTSWEDILREVSKK